ncbi:hypothetical protein BEP19_10825 [Ammoniphilus oxalaticus]|uniref:Uncharacterized protein n=1 Tax=Ammoniphilus oxalaticus TaxID=66863 RepID=A0A419SG23_9BACL|nr:hypothetical protein [Ammoniphilus oxalaticus]RKD22737.1 hypothetical protein BEP19_10825 [Ammoniphilus oxalaticus]
MDRETIEQTYSVKELEDKRKELRLKLKDSNLTEEEKWDYNDLLRRIDKRLRLMRDLLIELNG